MNKVVSWLFGHSVVGFGEGEAPALSLGFDSQENGAFSALQEHKDGGSSLQSLHKLFEILHGSNGRAIQFQYHVTRLNAGPFGRRVRVDFGHDHALAIACLSRLDGLP